MACIYFPLLLWQMIPKSACCCCVQLFVTQWTAPHQASLFSTISRSLNSCPLSQLWCHPTISSSVACPLLLLPSILPSIRIFFPPVNQLFASDGQNIGASALAPVLPVDIQDWFALGLIGLISLLSKGLSRVFSRTTVQKHQLFGAQPSLWSNSHIRTWLLEKP